MERGGKVKEACFFQGASEASIPSQMVEAMSSGNEELEKRYEKTEGSGSMKEEVKKKSGQTYRKLPTQIIRRRKNQMFREQKPTGGHNGTEMKKVLEERS